MFMIWKDMQQFVQSKNLVLIVWMDMVAGLIASSIGFLLWSHLLIFSHDGYMVLSTC